MHFISAFRNLLIGTGGAALISFFSISVAAHFIEVQYFGYFAIFSALLNIIVVVSNFRYDVAICQVDDNQRAVSLFLASLLFLLLFVFLTMFLGFCFGDWFLKEFVDVDINNVFDFVLPLSFSVLFMGVYQAATGLALYEKRYTEIAKSRLFQSIFGAITLIVLAFNFNESAWPLIFGLLAAQATGLSYILDFKKLNSSRRNVGLERFISYLFESYRFCAFSTVSTFFLILSPTLPAIIISKYIGSFEAGMFYFAVQITSAPFSLFRRLAANVVLAEARHFKPEKYFSLINKNRRSFFVVLGLLAICLWVYYFSSSKIFVLLFGEKWQGAGYISAVLAPMFFVDMISYSFFQILNVHARKWILFVIELSRFLLVVVGGFGVAYFYGDIKIFVVWYALSMILVYIFIIYLAHRSMVYHENINC